MPYNTFTYLKEYFTEKGIKLVNTFELDNNSCFDVENHIKVLGEFHNKVKGFNYHVSKCITNNLGKNIEEKKVEIKKNKRFMEEHKSEKIYENMYYIIKQAENSIEKVYESNYLELINRSMRNFEMCIGNSSYSNIIKKSEIEILSIEKCSYDMLENDGVYFLSKLKNKDSKIDYKSLIKLYCKEEKLDENSENYMIAVLSYPKESMKKISKYRLNKKSWNQDQFFIELKKASIKDKQRIINEVRECMN